MALVICGIYSDCIYMLIPGAVVYILMLCSLLMVIFLTGAFTIFPQDAARYIVSFCLGKTVGKTGRGQSGLRREDSFSWR